MKNILYLIPLFLLVSCFESPKLKTNEDIAQNNEIIKFIQDRARRDTILSYNNIYLGMSEEEFEKTNYYLLNHSLDDHDTIIDNNNTAYEVYVRAGCGHVDYNFDKPSVLDHIELSYSSFTAEKFNALRDLYISKYGPFSLYRVSSYIAADVHTVDNEHFYTELLIAGEDDMNGFEWFKKPSFVEYIWCWANCYICLCQDSEGVVIIYRLHEKNSKGEIDSYYFDYIFPQEPKTITDSDKKRLKESQSI